MSTTVMTSTNSLAVKRWEMETWLQALQQTVFGHMMARGAIYTPEELIGSNKVGDQVTFAYAGKLQDIPVGEGGTLDGNEEALDLKSHNMVMNVSRLGVLNPNANTIEQQRTYVKFDEVAKRQLQRRVAELVDTSVLYQLAGAAPTSLTIGGTVYGTASDLLHVQGHNTVVAPTSNRIIRAGGRANDQSLTSADKMSLDLIDNALEAAALTTQPLEMLDGNSFDLYISPEQMVDLMHDSTSKIQWIAKELSIAERGPDNMLEGRFKNNMVCAGKYRNVYIYEAPRTAYGVNGSTSAVITTARRAVLIGRDALSFASPFGSRLSDNDVPVKFFAQMKDYDYYKGMEARLIYGAKKMSPTSKDDIGTIVISTYAASHSI